MSAGLPPPFLIGESYIDRDGIYTVVDVQGSRVLVERPSGERMLADATVKARIHRNIVTEGEHPNRASRPARRGSTGPRFSLSEVLPLVARTIESLAGKARGYVAHDVIVDALLAHEQLQALLDHLEATDPAHKSRLWWANNFVQWFSHHITRGTSDWQTRFERRQSGGSWAYRPHLEGR